jgi:hypothetical protein
VSQVLYIINPESVLYDLNVLCEPPAVYCVNPGIGSYLSKPGQVPRRESGPGRCPSVPRGSARPRSGSGAGRLALAPPLKLLKVMLKEEDRKRLFLSGQVDERKPALSWSNIFQIGLRVYRVQGFLSSRTNWVPQPLTGKRVMPPRGSKGGRHTRLRGRGVHGPMGDIQFRRRDRQML